MKRLVKLFLVLALALGLSACQKGTDQAQVVNVYNWGEYMDPDLLRQFEEETGIRVIYSNFATNEDMYVKLKNGGASYDLIFPSEYMLQRLIAEDMLLPLDYEKIPNWKKIDSDFLNRDYDPEQKYSLPYFWGSLGILYNKKLVQGPIDSWDVLWDPTYAGNCIMLDSSRDSLAVALLRRGYAINTRDQKELDLATADLIAQYPLVYAYLVDQTRDIMINGECALAVTYSGDAKLSISKNPDLAYVVPKEGSNLWVDLFAIPKEAQNKENAEKLINFLLRPEVMAKNAEWVGYSLPSQAGRALLDEESRKSTVVYPDPAVLERLEVFHYLGDFVQVYDQLWQSVKNQ